MPKVSWDRNQSFGQSPQKTELWDICSTLLPSSQGLSCELGAFSPFHWAMPASTPFQALKQPLLSLAFSGAQAVPSVLQVRWDRNQFLRQPPESWNVGCTFHSFLLFSLSDRLQASSLLIFVTCAGLRKERSQVKWKGSSHFKAAALGLFLALCSPRVFATS